MIDTNKIKQTLRKSEKLAEIYGCKLNLGFSGGKDSVVLRYFAEYFGIDYIAHFNNTQIERHKGMIRFIRENYPDVHIVHPDRENSFFELMKKRGLPSIFRRWCCEKLKHSNPKLKEYRVGIMGVRGEESANRMKRGMVSVFGASKRAQGALEKLKATFARTDSQIRCEGGKDAVSIYPIFDLTEKEIFDIIKAEKLVIPDAYSSNRRLGCAFCPFASFRENLITIRDHSSLTKMWIKTLSGGDFIKTRHRSVSGKAGSTGLFYLYITKSLSTNESLRKGLMYLNEKDLHGKTGLQRFEEYLAECKITVI